MDDPGQLSAGAMDAQTRAERLTAILRFSSDPAKPWSNARGGQHPFADGYRQPCRFGKRNKSAWTDKPTTDASSARAPSVPVIRPGFIARFCLVMDREFASFQSMAQVRIELESFTYARSMKGA